MLTTELANSIGAKLACTLIGLDTGFAIAATAIVGAAVTVITIPVITHFSRIDTSIAAKEKTLTILTKIARTLRIIRTRHADIFASARCTLVRLGTGRSRGIAATIGALIGIDAIPVIARFAGIHPAITAEWRPRCG